MYELNKAQHVDFEEGWITKQLLLLLIIILSHVSASN